MSTRSDIKKWGVREPGIECDNGLFRSITEFYKRLDDIQATQAAWLECDIEDRKGQFKCKAWMRDPMAVLQEILDNPMIKDKVVWAPRKMYDQAGNRVYTDLYTTDWWWEMQVSTTYNSLLIQGNTRQNL